MCVEEEECIFEYILGGVRHIIKISTHIHPQKSHRTPKNRSSHHKFIGCHVVEIFLKFANIKYDIGGDTRERALKEEELVQGGLRNQLTDFGFKLSAKMCLRKYTLEPVHWLSTNNKVGDLALRNQYLRCMCLLDQISQRASSGLIWKT